MDQIDLWLSAAAMIQKHGEDAALVAASRSDTLLAQDDTKGAGVWLRIIEIIVQLEERPTDAALN